MKKRGWKWIDFNFTFLSKYNHRLTFAHVLDEPLYIIYYLFVRINTQYIYIVVLCRSPDKTGQSRLSLAIYSKTPSSHLSILQKFQCINVRSSIAVKMLSWQCSYIEVQKIRLCKQGGWQGLGHRTNPFYCFTNLWTFRLILTGIKAKKKFFTLVFSFWQNKM